MIAGAERDLLAAADGIAMGGYSRALLALDSGDAGIRRVAWDGVRHENSGLEEQLNWSKISRSH